MLCYVLQVTDLPGGLSITKSKSLFISQQDLCYLPFHISMFLLPFIFSLSLFLPSFLFLRFCVPYSIYLSFLRFFLSSSIPSFTSFYVCFSFLFVLLLPQSPRHPPPFSSSLLPPHNGDDFFCKLHLSVSSNYGSHFESSFNTDLLPLFRSLLLRLSFFFLFLLLFLLLFP